MRNLWVDAGNDCDWQRAKAHEMTGIFYPVTDPIADVRRRVRSTKEHGYTVGVFMASNWPEFTGLGGASIADKMHSLVASVEQGGIPVKVQFDYEAHDPVQIRAMLSRWRALRPKQDTSWTCESFQGGWMGPVVTRTQGPSEFVQAIIALHIRVVPQLYTGKMADIELRELDPAEFWKQIAAEQVAQDMALRDLTRRGFPEALVTGFYDAATLPLRGAEGFFFTQGRLP